MAHTQVQPLRELRMYVFAYVVNILVHPSALWGVRRLQKSENNEDRGGGSLHEVLEPVLSG